MPQIMKTERNQDIVFKRKSGWTYTRLSKHFNIDIRAVWEICQRDLYNKPIKKKV